MPFKKGKSGNPNGAPVKEMRIATWIEKELDQVVSRETDEHAYEAQVSTRQYLAKTLVKRALEDRKDALDYAKEVIDRTEGKPHQSTDITSKGEKIVMPILGGLSVPADDSDQESS